MTTIRVQASLPSVNAIPADAATNTWHFISDAVDRLDDAAGILAALNDFYEAVQTCFGAWMSGDINYRFYDLEDPQPRAPFFTDVGLFTAAGGVALPSEVAIVMSYGGDNISGIPVGRRRGRIYLGTLDADCVDTGANGVVVDAGYVTLIANAGQALMNAGTGESWKWAIFSPTTAGPEPWSTGDLLAATLHVTQGHVDNAFDTVRSRGIAADDRETW